MITYLFIIIIIIFLRFLYFKYTFESYTYNIQIKKLLNPIFKLSYFDPYIYRAFNPCVFEYSNVIYNTFRLATGSFFNLYKIYEYFTSCSKYYPSKICIQSINETSEIILPDIKYISEYCNITLNKIYKFTGYEDCRSIIVKEYLYLICSVFAESAEYCQMGIIQIKVSDLNKKAIYPVNFKLLQPSFINKCSQKNWMPFVYNSELYLVYSVNPHKILKCNLQNFTVRLEYETSNLQINKNIRGGSNISEYNSYKFGKVYLGITHIRRHMYYTNIFYIFEIKPPFKIIGISNEFIIYNSRIHILKNTNHLKYFWNLQFTSGLHIDNSDINIYYGVNNSYSMKFTIQNYDLDKLLNSV